jgi:hypothetical protein
MDLQPVKPPLAGEPGGQKLRMCLKRLAAAQERLLQAKDEVAKAERAVKIAYDSWRAACNRRTNTQGHAR